MVMPFPFFPSQKCSYLLKFNSTFELNLLEPIQFNLAKLKETEFDQIGFNRIQLSFTK